MKVLDSTRKRVFVAPLGTLFTLDAGAFTDVVFEPNAGRVMLTIADAVPEIAGASTAPKGRLVNSKTLINGTGADLKPSEALDMDAGAWVIPFKNGKATVTFS